MEQMYEKEIKTLLSDLQLFQKQVVSLNTESMINSNSPKAGSRHQSSVLHTMTSTPGKVLFPGNVISMPSSKGFISKLESLQKMAETLLDKENIE